LKTNQGSNLKKGKNIPEEHAREEIIIIWEGGKEADSVSYKIKFLPPRGETTLPTRKGVGRGKERTGPRYPAAPEKSSWKWVQRAEDALLI